MNDVFSKKKRSEIMSHIRGKDTTPEIRVRKYLYSKGFRYRKNDNRYPGTPDIVLLKHKTVIFVHGCFWHGHEKCKNARIPKTNTEFWVEKIQGNIARDIRNIEELQKMGFHVLVVWECELKRDFYSVMNHVVECILDN